MSRHRRLRDMHRLLLTVWCGSIFAFMLYVLFTSDWTYTPAWRFAATIVLTVINGLFFMLQATVYLLRDEEAP